MNLQQHIEWLEGEMQRATKKAEELYNNEHPLAFSQRRFWQGHARAYRYAILRLKGGMRECTKDETLNEIL